MGEIVETSTLVKQPRQRCYTSGDEIKQWNEIEEVDKPEFTELSDAGIMSMFKDMIKIEDDGELEVEPLGPEYNFSELYGADYYAEKFPGFCDETYEIMARAHIDVNAIEA
jgi:hypothetical protein